MIICIEGIDGSGKATQSELLAESLKASGKEVLLLSYPDYKSESGKRIREYLHSKESMPEVKQLFKMYIDDIAKDSEKIREAGKNGIVVLDRYYMSTVAYQCAQGFGYAKAKETINAMRLPKPDLIIYLNISPQDSAVRKMKEGEILDRHERNMDLLRGVGREYEREMSDGFPIKRWVEISAIRSKDDIHHLIMKEVGKVSAKTESRKKIK